MEEDEASLLIATPSAVVAMTEAAVTEVVAVEEALAVAMIAVARVDENAGNQRPTQYLMHRQWRVGRNVRTLRCCLI